MKTKRRIFFINILIIFSTVSVVITALAYIEIKSNFKTIKVRELSNVLIVPESGRGVNNE